MSAEEFTRYRLAAFQAVNDGQAKREEASGSQLPPEFDIIDHLTALKALVAPLKQDFVNVMYACINTCWALFPDRKDARSTSRLIKLLNEGKKRLQL